MFFNSLHCRCDLQAPLRPILVWCGRLGSIDPAGLWQTSATARGARRPGPRRRVDASTCGTVVLLFSLAPQADPIAMNHVEVRMVTGRSEGQARVACHLRGVGSGTASTGDTGSTTRDTVYKGRESPCPMRGKLEVRRLIGIQAPAPWRQTGFRQGVESRFSLRRDLAGFRRFLFHDGRNLWDSYHHCATGFPPKSNCLRRKSTLP